MDDRIERAAGRHDRAAIGPMNRLLRRALALARRVRHRKHDRAIVDGRHRADHGFRKQAGCTRRADENRRLEIADGLFQRDVRGIVARVRRDLLNRPGVRRLEVLHLRPRLRHESPTVHRADALSGLLVGEPRVAQRRHEEVGNPLRGRPGSAEHEPLVAHRSTGNPQGGVHASGRDGSRALNVVVERAQPVTKARELGQRVGLQKVFPLQDGVRVHAHDGVDESVDEVLIRRSPDPSVPQAEIQRVVQPLLIVGAHVEQDRQRQIRRDSGARGVEGQLPDRDSHPADPLIAEPEDPLTVGDDDDSRQPRMVGEDGVDVVPLLVRDVKAARVAVDVRGPLARLAHHRRVHDRHHLVDVVVEEAEEQRLVPVLQAGEVDVTLERRLLDAIVLVHTSELLLHRADGWRHEPVEAELCAFRCRERRALVREGIAEQRLAARVDRDVLLARDAIVLR